MPCQDKGMPSRAARGYRKLGADGCRRKSWSKELDGEELRGTLGGERVRRLLNTVDMASPSFFIQYSVVC